MSKVIFIESQIRKLSKHKSNSYLENWLSIEEKSLHWLATETIIIIWMKAKCQVISIVWKFVKTHNWFLFLFLDLWACERIFLTIISYEMNNFIQKHAQSIKSGFNLCKIEWTSSTEIAPKLFVKWITNWFLSK